MTSLLNYHLSPPCLIFHFQHRDNFRGQRLTDNFVPSFAEMPINRKVCVRRIGDSRGEVNYVAGPMYGNLKEVAGKLRFERSSACGVNVDRATDPVCLLDRI